MSPLIRTTHERDSLPVGSLGIDDNYATTWRDPDGWWVSIGGVVNFANPRLPMTLLYRPDVVPCDVEDAMRERIAGEIEARAAGCHTSRGEAGPCGSLWRRGMEDAARIARGVQG